VSRHDASRDERNDESGAKRDDLEQQALKAARWWRREDELEGLCGPFSVLGRRKKSESARERCSGK
jgi:hypothetical protein